MSSLTFMSITEMRLAMPGKRGDMIPGTLDLLVLKLLDLGPMHGYGIAEILERGTEHVLSVNQGSLYPALYRLERQRWIRSEWRTSTNNRRARYWSVTAAGRRQLGAERENWIRLSAAVNAILHLTTT
jgi:transcriptional regulator